MALQITKTLLTKWIELNSFYTRFSLNEDVNGATIAYQAKWYPTKSAYEANANNFFILDSIIQEEWDNFSTPVVTKPSSTETANKFDKSQRVILGSLGADLAALADVSFANSPDNRLASEFANVFGF